MSTEITRRFVPPLGWPLDWRAVTVTPADRQTRFVVANRYPGQVIGLCFRLPDHEPLNADQKHGNHRSLSIRWAKPARWWAKR